MDNHFLTPLFMPRSVVVFAGPRDDPDRQTRQARVLCAALEAAPGTSPPQFLHGDTTGTLGELARSRADLAIIALPTEEIAAALEMAGRIACRSALIVSDGVDAEHAAQLKRIARREGVHLLGPNCLGFQRPHLKLNASAAGPLAAEGSLALVSQSGALTSAMLDWARQNHVGFSQVVSLGPNAAVDLAQVLDFLATDNHTQSIVVYLEGISSARRFMSALRSASHAKPVVVLKAGRRSAGNEAALTHSRAIVGSDDVFDAALRRAGAVRVRSFVELFSAAKCLAARYRPVGKRLAIVTNGGGPGVLAADWVSEIGLQLGRLSPEAAAGLQPRLPALASLADLIDLSAAATPEHFRAAVEAAAQDASVDGLLVVYAPQIGSDATETARAVVAAKASTAKPLLACWMGDSSVLEARHMLNEAAIANFRTPEAAVGAFGNIASFYANQQLLMQTPPPMSNLAQPDVEAARLLIESVLAERRRTLTEMESKALLAAFHIPVTQTVLARTANEAMMLATQMGFPVALKIDSPDIAHKSDVQGVALNIQSGSAARDTYNEMVARVKRLQPQARINGVTVQKMARARRGREVCVGLVTDEAFGPVIVFGAGGTMIELIADRAMELPPLNQFLARRLIERARVAETLAQGWHGGELADLEALERVLLRVSEMVCEFPQLREMDINPLIVDENGAIAVDARVVLQPGTQPGSPRAFDYPHLAILPYPAHFEQVWPLAGGGEVTVRPVRPDDAQMLQDLVRGLKPESRYFRFASAIKELPPGLLARLTLIDYDREMALVAVYCERTARDDGGFDESERIVGVSRIITNPDQTSCEFSLLVADDFGGKGLGSRLMEGIMDAAREKGLADIEGLVLSNNADMLKLMRGLGFTIKPFAEEPDFRLVTRPLQG
ncbi:bifunctional acetate--CoA ligase family protein/GNAT family N-acetyltransferase [Roseateles sp.]|uniref:bifunctional acetate--CoA ligase family protein/GNAT family N-acetyltransferase n=1 Tax=Roseateles sp. TaxID=1971397 RepID=UPI002E01B387|nr:bifunctional acetate--CoA ligase family protein/GNAT family N-acetyltransferase [Roseateles sp.]